MKIQTNSSGTRSIEIADQHLQTIEKYLACLKVMQAKTRICWISVWMSSITRT